MTKKNYYEILGVPESASDDAIKTAYRKLARKFHPDVSKEANAEEKFKDLSVAYETLKDASKRKKYDEMLRYGAYEPPPESAQPFSYFYTSEPSEQYEDIFSQIFGGNRRAHARSQQSNQDNHTAIFINLEEAYHGCEKIINDLKIKIPKGILDQHQIRLKGQGENQHPGAPGDLYITVNIAKHPFFELRNQDIYIKAPVLPWEAALGKTITVPTLGGKVQLKLPPNSQTEQILRLKGRGMPTKTPGDQFVIIKIVNPSNLDPETINLYNKLAEHSHSNPRTAIFGE